MTDLDRRNFILTGAAGAVAATGSLLPLSGAWGRLAPAMPLAAPPATPGFYRYRVGEMTITILGDGSFQLPADFFGANVSPEQRAEYYRSRLLSLDAFRLTANPAVIHTGSRLVLVDAGRGAPGDPPQSTGWLPASLAAAGIAAEEIDLVIVTHAHTDHIGGLVDPVTRAPRFPNAEVVVSEVEHALWTAADAERRLPAWAVEWGLLTFSREVFAALGDRVRTIPMEGEVTAGIRSIGTPGHTPGHIGLLLETGAEQMLLVGDAIVNPHVHFEYPKWQLAVDHDPEQGVRTRQRLLDRAATDHILIQGFHLPFPGIGRAIREGGAYRWLPDA